MNYIFLLLCCFMTIVDYYFLVRMIEGVFGNLSTARKRNTICVFLIIVSCLLLKFNYINTVFSTALIIVLLYIYPKNFSKKLIIYLNLNIIIIALQDIYRESCLLFSDKNTTKMYLYYILFHIIFWMITVLISKVCSYRNERVVFNRGIVGVMLLYPILIVLWNTGYGYYITSNISNDNIDNLVYNIGFLSWAITIFISLLFIYMYGLIERQFIKEREKTILEKEIYSKERYYRDIENMQYEIRGIRHDMKNQISTALYLLHKGDVDGCIEILNTQNESIKQTEDIVYTGNSVIDSVLNIKNKEAKKYGIDTSYSISIPENMKLCYGYMVVIIGNILDNAIEANMKVDGDRYIKISIKYINNMLIARFENPYVDCSDVEDRFVTTKDDKLNHGYGLNNIRQAIELIGGDLKIEKENNIFSTTFILYKVEIDKAI